MVYEFYVPQEHVRSISDPNTENSRTLYVLLRVADVPNDLPLDPDPRVPKQHGPIVKRIVRSLGTNDGRFHLLNRGITISARGVRYDNEAHLLHLDIPEDD